MSAKAALPPDPRTIADMIPVRLAEIAARNAPTCSTKDHGAMVPRDLGKQPYEVMWCGTWYDCPDPWCSSSGTYPSRELAAAHGEPYVVDRSHWERWDGAVWVAVSNAEFDAYWAERLAGQVQAERDRRERTRQDKRRDRRVGVIARPAEHVDDAAERHDHGMFGDPEAEPDWATAGYDPAAR